MAVVAPDPAKGHVYLVRIATVLILTVTKSRKKTVAKLQTYAIGSQVGKVQYFMNFDAAQKEKAILTQLREASYLL